MYRENSLAKIEEDNTSFFNLWKNWWRSKEPRLPNERKTFEFIFSQTLEPIGTHLKNDQNKTIFDLHGRKIVLNTYYSHFLNKLYLELSFFDFSRKYRKKDLLCLKFKEENLIFQIIGVHAKRLTLFGPPIITKLICENKFI